MSARACTQIADAIAVGKPFYALEFFPPHTVEGARNLVARMDRMSRLKVPCIPHLLSLNCAEFLAAPCMEYLRIIFVCASQLALLPREPHPDAPGTGVTRQCESCKTLDKQHAHSYTQSPMNPAAPCNGRERLPSLAISLRRRSPWGD